MPVAVDAEVIGLQQVQANMSKIAAELHGMPIVNAMRQGTLLISADAKKAAPVDTGRLRASITPDVRMMGAEVVGVIGSNVEYAPYMEFGTKPHWPPPGALAVWARRHGMVEFLVARAIAMRGLAPRKFLQGAFEKNKAHIEQLIERAINQVVTK